jgi:taurine dioxygenase
MLTIKPSGAVLGAEITGVDLSQPLDDATFNQFLAAFLQYEVVCFRDQTLTPEQHIAFSKRLGELERHVRVDCCRPGYPELFVVSNVIENGKPIGSQDAGLFWHSDLCYMEEPSLGSLLYAHEVPVSKGRVLGDTLFASATAAYEALPEATRARIDKLQAVNSYEHGYYRDRKNGKRAPLTEEQKRKTPDVAHPIARTHPATGKKCLFVNEGYTSRIVGLDEKASDALLAELIAHATDERFIYRHHWRVGDLLIWDNCATQHLAIHDYALPLRRRMERTTIKGARPH